MPEAVVPGGQPPRPRQRRNQTLLGSGSAYSAHRPEAGCAACRPSATLMVAFRAALPAAARAATGTVAGIRSSPSNGPTTLRIAAVGAEQPLIACAPVAATAGGHGHWSPPLLGSRCPVHDRRATSAPPPATVCAQTHFLEGARIIRIRWDVSERADQPTYISKSAITSLRFPPHPAQSSG